MSGYPIMRYLNLDDIEILSISPEGVITLFDNVKIFTGFGSPEGVVTANVGSLYIEAQESTNVVWHKVTGTGNTGWSPLGGGGGSVILQVNGVNITNQGALNLIDGANITISNPSGSDVQIDAAVPVLPNFFVDDVSIIDPTNINFVSGSNITISNPSDGNIQIDSAGGGGLSLDDIFWGEATLGGYSPSSANVTLTPGYASAADYIVLISDVYPVGDAFAKWAVQYVSGTVFNIQKVGGSDASTVRFTSIPKGLMSGVIA